MTHLELIDPQDISRFRMLTVIPLFQPFWAYSDSYITDLTLPALGPSRTGRLYPIGSVAKTGAVIAAGSDWPVSSMNPLDAIQVALTRQNPDSPKDPAWIPQEKMDLAAMIAAYTINGAFLNGEEGRRDQSSKERPLT
jgi:predicted amidohydrolase YtcJ